MNNSGTHSEIQFHAATYWRINVPSERVTEKSPPQKQIVWKVCVKTFFSALFFLNKSHI